MNYGTGTDTEFDDVRHGYAPPRQQNRVVPPHHNETRAEDVAFGFADARNIGLGVRDAADAMIVDQEDRQAGRRIAVGSRRQCARNDGAFHPFRQSAARPFWTARRLR